MAPCYCLDKTVDLMPTMNQLALQSMQNHGLHGSSSRTVDVRHNEDEHKLVFSCFLALVEASSRRGTKIDVRCVACMLHGTVRHVVARQLSVAQHANPKANV